MADKKFDLVVFGATGFTGQLVCTYLQKQHALGREFSWAMAGRSLEKLETLRASIGAGGVAVIKADADDPESIRRLTSSARVVIAIVGPYQLYGSDLLAACASSGTDYVDLCGEPLWMREMIDRYEGIAKASGARILFSSGFDSIPAELGVWLCQREAERRIGKPMPRIRGRMRTFVGGPWADRWRAGWRR